MTRPFHQSCFSDICNILPNFEIDGELKGIVPFGNGHINDTYRATFFTSVGKQDYLLQRINHQVFLQPERVMENIVRVTKHIRAQLTQCSANQIHRYCLTLVPTRGGQYHLIDSMDNYWRVYHFIENGTSYDFVPSARHTFSAGQILGRFQAQLADLPAATFWETIADFHDTAKRYNRLDAAIAQAPPALVKAAGREIEFARRRRPLAETFSSLRQNEKLPTRVVHNDTKINNFMFDDESGDAICLLDLDTVGPGLVLYDFGDLIRTATCPAKEDETDLEKVVVQPQLLSAAIRGYMDKATAFLTKPELEHLPMAGKLITLETGVRFLTDFLLQNIYFKTQYPHQNLDRCRNQFQLAMSLEQKEADICRLFQECAQSAERSSAGG